MKNLSSLVITGIAAAFLFAIIIFQNSCKGKGTDQTGIDSVKVNPAFQMSPPIARDITIRQLKDNQAGNILFVADLGNQLGKEKFHAVQVEDQKIVLRDDGQGGDEQANDGKFSVVLKQDINELQSQIDLSATKLRGLKEVIDFNGRTMVHLPMEQVNFQEDFKRFRADQVFRIPPGLHIICSSPVTVLKDHSLMITDPSVVEDTGRTFNPCTKKGNPKGVWSFPRLITEMANTPLTGVQPGIFLLRWLKTWQIGQPVNGETIGARSQIIQIINSWQSMSGGTFDIRFAPFKLIAIVNRIDLRGNSGYSLSNAGEGRFVFCATTCNDGIPGVLRNPAPFMVIFEYGVPKNKCSALKAYAQQWVNLSSMTVGSPAFNAALEAITNQFTLAGTSPSKPNGSSLNQLRTNEFALGSLPWELREFNIDSTTHLLKNVTTKREPQVSFNNIHAAHVASDVVVMANFINSHTPDVEATKYQVPEIEAGRNFLAGHAETINPITYHWDGTAAPGPGFIVSDSARFIFSLNTCSGCHGGEASTSNFMHVAPGGPTGIPAILSKFLTGDPAMSSSPFLVPDGANRPAGKIREFNDLERRKIDLENFVQCSCSKLPIFSLVAILRFDPLRMTH